MIAESPIRLQLRSALNPQQPSTHDCRPQQRSTDPHQHETTKQQPAARDAGVQSAARGSSEEVSSPDPAAGAFGHPETTDGKLDDANVPAKGNGHANGNGRTSTPRADVPLVRIRLGKLPAAVAESNRLLADRSRATYVLGDILVTLEDLDGRLVALPASPTRIGLELARVARFERIVRSDKDGEPVWGTCDPPMKLAMAIAEEPGGWRVPALAGLTDVPILRPDGRLVTRPGYDKTSRLFLHGGPFEPAGDDPYYALAVLKDALSEFSFVDKKHRSAALSLLLTTVCRRSLSSAPLFGVSARDAGTGKGTLATLAAIMATGKRGGRAAVADRQCRGGAQGDHVGPTVGPARPDARQHRRPAGKLRALRPADGRDLERSTPGG